jgi:hypothetical protein
VVERGDFPLFSHRKTQNILMKAHTDSTDFTDFFRKKQEKHPYQHKVLTALYDARHIFLLINKLTDKNIYLTS